MIVNDRALTVDAAAFANGLDRAMKAVVRIQGTGPWGQTIASGWMLTPAIAIVPEHVIGTSPDVGDTPTSDWLIQSILDGKVIWQERSGQVVRLPGEMPGLDKNFRIALIVLRKPHRIPRLGLTINAPTAAEFATVLSFARGEQRMTLSIGLLTAVEEFHLDYDATTEPGSSGAPVLDGRLQVLGMHMMAGGGFNRGVSRSAIVAMLQRFPQWEQVAEFHRIANVTAGRKQLAMITKQKSDQPDPALIRAAVQLNFAPGRLSKQQREVLRASVVDPELKPWTLQSKVRQSVIQSVGSLEVLRKYAPAESTSVGQRVIGKILAGPPYDLAKQTEEELSWWIQASRWFVGVAPDLPTPAQANRELQRRRVRGRLNALAGPDFFGRTAELETIGDWYKRKSQEPLCISGVGGVGKSALVARFVTELPEDTLILWLDFDRADLAPDDAVSVINALAAQATVQLDGFTVPAVSETNWQASAQAFGNALADRKLKRPPLVVLDSFEVAQYAERYQELWPVLEELGKGVPRLRVIVSGRVLVTTLKLLGHDAVSLPLKGLKPKDASAWLHRHGIRSERVVKDVVERSRGLPLVLHLAVRLVEAGGKVSDLPKTLPPEIITGFLYDRILDRVQHPSLKPLAQGALVLRRLTEDAIEPVLKGRVDLPPGKPENWFRDLSREASLVDGTSVLRLRPEVRSAALELLEHDNPKLVRSVDEAAARWYATRDVNDPEIAAELVYHRLRLGDQAGAKDAWRDGVSQHLQYADEGLKGAARTWLHARLGSGSVQAAPLEAWEHEAADRIRGARQRSLKRAAPQILTERVERTQDSTLVFHEAYEMRERDEKQAALDHLSHAGTASSAAVDRERSLLHALLLGELGRRTDADAVLRPLCFVERWSDRPREYRELAAVCAARVRLAVDFDLEFDLLTMMESKNKRPVLLKATSRMDVLLPELDELLEDTAHTAARSFSISIRTDKDVADAHLKVMMERIRGALSPAEPPLFRAIRERISAGEYPASSEWQTSQEVGALLMNAWRRWSIFSQTPLFFGAVQMVKKEKIGALDAGIIATYALFAVAAGLVILLADDVGGPTHRLDALVDKAIGEYVHWRSLSGSIAGLRKNIPERLISALTRAKSAQSNTPRNCALLLHYCTPDPLEVLVDRFAGKVRTGG